jgi:hypothetical protein
VQAHARERERERERERRIGAAGRREAQAQRLVIKEAVQKPQVEDTTGGKR